MVGRAVHECQCAVCQVGTDKDINEEHRRINVMVSTLNEAQRRWYVGSMSQAKDGYRDRELSRITGLDVKTIRRGRREIASERAIQMGNRVRRAGGGRQRAEKK